MDAQNTHASTTAPHLGNKPDTEHAIEFLRSWHGNAPWLLCAIVPDGKIETRVFTSGQEADAARWIDGWQGKANLYFHVNRTRPNFSKRPTKEDIELEVALHVDVDPRDGLGVATERNRILSELQSYDPPPSVIIDSGGGYGGFWLLREPVNDLTGIELRNRHLENQLGGDHCHHVSRLMRLPGTVNLPNKKKREKGRKVSYSKVVEAHWERRYSLDDFPAAQDEPPSPKPKPRPKPADDPPPNDDQGPGDLNALKPELRELIISGDASKWKGNRSSLVWYVACSLVREGWGDDQIAALLLDPAHGVNAHVREASNPHAYAMRQATKARASVADDQSQYRVIDGAIHYRKPGAARFSPLCNFNARITEFLKIDDGSDHIIAAFRISGTTANGTPLPMVTIPADKLNTMWWLSEWGGCARVEPGLGMSRFWHALAELSDPIPPHVIYAHTGWRKIDGAWLFLHGGGAVGANGPVDGIKCEPGGVLNEYVLPPPRNLTAAINASLGLLDLGPIGCLSYAAAYRAPLCEFAPINYSPWLAGRTGSLKSALAGTTMGHFGPTWDYQHLPDNWTSTANTLEMRAYRAKDVPFVIDDAAPQRTERAQKEQHDKAERVLRNQRNRQGRGRLNHDSTLKDVYPSRGLIMGTGEDVPHGSSLRAGLFIAQTEAGGIKLSEVVKIDRDVKKGLLAEAMAGYVQHLAGHADKDRGALCEALSKRQTELIESIGSHNRTPANLASLLLGLDQGLAFAVAAGAINEQRRDQLLKTAQSHLRLIAMEQAQEIAEEDEVIRFLRSIQTALMSGHAHIASKAGNDPWPGGLEAVTGWQEAGKDASLQTLWRAQGKRIGWLDDDNLMLDPEAAMIVAQQLSRGQGRTMAISESTLAKRLKEAKKLTKTAPGRNAYQTRIKGAQTWVWVLSAHDVLGFYEDQATMPFADDADRYAGAGVE